MGATEESARRPLLVVEPTAEPDTAVVALSGPIARTDLPELPERVCVALAGCDAAIIICDVQHLVPADAVVVDALARLQLAARRFGRCIRVRHAPVEVQELLRVTGLAGFLPLCAD